MPTKEQLESAKQEAMKICESHRTLPEGRLARNVIGVEIGDKIKNNKSLGYECVRFYVERKIESEKAMENRHPNLLIPKKLGEVDTDVIETRPFVSFQSPAPTSKARPGSLVGFNYDAPNVDATRSGTLGAFVKIGEKTYVLGANHVMAVNGRVPTGTPILFRPPGKFADPDKFDIFRPREHRHLAFTSGPHVCIGQHLARVEMERALNSILDRLPNLRLDPDMPPPAAHGYFLRSPDHLYVRFD